MFYYQQTTEIKLLATMSVFLSDYVEYSPDDDPIYYLNINYEALSYFNLINNFQFSLPIYIVLFIVVAILNVMMIAIFWLFTFIFCPCLLKYRRSPALRFTHMVRVLFKQPIVGTMMANIPVVVAGGLLKWL